MKKEYIQVQGLTVEVWWKAVKRINLVVYAKECRVRISAPYFTPKVEVEGLIRAKMEWIKKKQKELQEQKSTPEMHYRSGETVCFLGEEYGLAVVDGAASSGVVFDPKEGIVLHMGKNNCREERRKVLLAWYRDELALRIPPLLAKWQPQVGEEVLEWRIKRMKTRWGTCNIAARRIWLNLELIRRPERCIEYILVHEMVHLLVPGHSAKFYQYMDTLLQDWRDVDRLLTGRNYSLCL